MKHIRVLTLIAVSLASPLAFADATLPAGLGQTKAIYDYCSQVDPADAGQFQQMWNYSAGNPKLQPAVGFQDRYNSTMTSLKTLAKKGSLVGGCKGGAGQWRDSNRHPQSDDRKPDSGKRE